MSRVGKDNEMRSDKHATEPARADCILIRAIIASIIYRGIIGEGARRGHRGRRGGGGRAGREERRGGGVPGRLERQGSVG